MNVFLTFSAAVALTGVQLLPSLLRGLPDHHRRRLHSAAGGVAVTFVFLHLLPEIDRLREPVSDHIGSGVPLAEQDVFLLALAGLVVFYGIEVVARRSRRRKGNATSWADHVGIGVFAGYYAVIGYLLRDQSQRGVDNLIVYALAMGLHFLVVDYGLVETHREAYERTGRWVLAAAVLGGWAAGWAIDVPEWGVGIILAVFAGALFLVSLKEELPAEREGHYVAFVAGAAFYAAVLATVDPSIGA